jgi:hypothetical protein
MIPTPVEAKRCPKCGLPLVHVAGIDRCQNCGQIGVKYQGDTCPNNCAAPVVQIPGAGRRCQACGRQW